MRCIQGQSDFPFIRPQEHVEAGLRPLRENDYSELPNMFFPATFTKRSCLRAHEATCRRRRPLRFLRLNDFFRRPPAGAFPIRRRGNCYGARRRPGIWQGLDVTAVVAAPCGRGLVRHGAFSVYFSANVGGNRTNGREIARRLWNIKDFPTLLPSLSVSISSLCLLRVSFMLHRWSLIMLSWSS